MFHSLFSSHVRSKCLSVFSICFVFSLWSVGTAKYTRWKILFSFANQHEVWSSDCDQVIRLFHGSHLQGQILISAHTIWYYGQILISCTNPDGSPFNRKWNGKLEIRGRIETTALLGMAKILSSILETWRDLMSLRFEWNKFSVRRCENLARSRISIAVKNSINFQNITIWK